MSKPVSLSESRHLQAAPRLSSQGLTYMLVVMCMVPVVTITALFWYLPKVHEGELEVSITAENLPPGSYYDYDTYYEDRPAVEPGILIVNNESDQDWTNIAIVVNWHYDVQEHTPIRAGSSRRFLLDRFVSRSGARFDLRYNPLRHVRVYARRPTSDRATYDTDFDWKAVQ